MTVVKWSPCSVNNSPLKTPTSVKSPRVLRIMSSPKKVRGVEAGVGPVARRPSSEVVREIAALARQDRQKMTTPVPPTPRPPGKFWITRRPPLPPPINPYVPTSPERRQSVRVAAVWTHAHQEREAWLLKEAEELARRPRTPSPPRRDDDHYDLARWNRQRWR